MPLGVADSLALQAELSARQPQMLRQLESLARINSGSFHLEGIQQVADQLKSSFLSLGADWQTVSHEPWRRLHGSQWQSVELAPSHLVRCRPDAPRQFLLVGHLDTVFPPEHDFRQVWREGERLRGPGVADLKGGLVVMLEALRAFEAYRPNADWGWTVLLNGDEELGSPGSAQLLEKQARLADWGLVFEPSLPEGKLAAARRGSGNLRLRIQGRAAHTGRDPDAGLNALLAAARISLKLAQQHAPEQGRTIVPSLMQAGTVANQVPEWAGLNINIRLQQAEQWAEIEKRLDEAVAEEQQAGFRCERDGGLHRPVKPRDQKLVEMFEHFADCAKRLGQAPLQWQDTGGACDGNNLAAAGLCNLDTLGVIGGAIHSDQEWMQIDSLHQRAALSACFMLDCAQRLELA